MTVQAVVSNNGGNIAATDSLAASVLTQLESRAVVKSLIPKPKRVASTVTVPMACLRNDGCWTCNRMRENGRCS